jgi:hypothetical protein
MDHKTNAALYRLRAGTELLEYVGDARSASESANNWKPGETAEKFHTRPLWHGGRVYVATMDRSRLSGEYLERRGFHIYAYDPADGLFRDLTASEEGGTGAPHGNLVTLASDPTRDVIYGAGVPTSDVFRFNVHEGVTAQLGRPQGFDQPYVYSGRVMWVDSRGRLYFTAGNPAYGPSDPSVYGHVYFYDPETGFGERKDWPLREPRALEVGQCIAQRKSCFFADDQGHIYRFEDEGPTWTYVGQIKTEHPGTIWLFHVEADGKTAFTVATHSRKDREPSSIYAFDLESGSTKRLINLADLDPGLAERNVHTGYDAWDSDGRFYFASFSGGSDKTVMVTRIDPSALKMVRTP